MFASRLATGARARSMHPTIMPTIRIFLPDTPSGMVSRVFEPLLLHITTWLRRSLTPYSIVPPRQQQNYSFGQDDVALFIGVDTFTGRRFPFRRLDESRAHGAIIYQTEPLASSRCFEFGWEYLRRALSQLRVVQLELWDYSAANIKAIRRSAASPRPGPMRCLPTALGKIVNGSAIRHIPPGFSPSLAVGARRVQHLSSAENDVRHAQLAASALALAVEGYGSGLTSRWDSRLAFLGHAQYRSAECWRALNGSDGWLTTHFTTVRAWTPSDLKALLSKHLVWANIHQHCGRVSSPLEAFRLVSLLSNGAACLSERSDPDDMQLFDGLVTFCNFSALRDCHASLAARELATSGGVAAARAWRANEFARRFTPERLCARAGCTDGVLKDMSRRSTIVRGHGLRNVICTAGTSCSV